MRYALSIAALAAVSFISPASATIWITGDSGGQIGPYIQRVEAMRRSGDRVVIDGPCLSACTMVLGSIPRNRICVTARAQLGFHAAYDLDQSGGQITNRGGTALLMNHYPQQVRSWIARHGGLSRQMIYLSGRELSSMYPSCDSLPSDNSPAVSASRGGAAPDFSQSSSQVRADAWRQESGASSTSATKPIGRTSVHKSRRGRHPPQS
jgi:hypothetical protein